MPAKKNKRGDRGSKEEISASKKSNMAANLGGNLEGHIKEVFQSLTDREEEPSLLEIKNLLLAINHSLNSPVSSILSEDKALRKEIEELKASINFNNSELKDLKGALSRTNNENKALKKSLDLSNERIKTDKENFRKPAQELAQLWITSSNIHAKAPLKSKDSKRLLLQYRRCGNHSSGSAQYYG